MTSKTFKKKSLSQDEIEKLYAAIRNAGAILSGATDLQKVNQQTAIINSARKKLEWNGVAKALGY